MSEMKALVESAGRMKRQLDDARASGKFSESYLEEFEAKQRRDLTNLITDAKAKVRRQAEVLRMQARESYLLAAVDTFAVKENQIFRDFSAAAGIDELSALAAEPGDMSAEHALILCGELRRRGQDAMADLLASLRPPSAEPWTVSDEWREADKLLAEFEQVDAHQRIAEQLDTGHGPYLLMDDGVKSIDEILFT